MMLHNFNTKAVIFALISPMFVSCTQDSEEELPSFLERGIYRSDPTGDEIMIGDVDAFVTFKGKRFVVVAFETADDGILTFSPISGREDEFQNSAISRSQWYWEPRVIRQQADDGTVLQAFSLQVQ
jgi:hypothetical protein